MAALFAVLLASAPVTAAKAFSVRTDTGREWYLDDTPESIAYGPDQAVWFTYQYGLGRLGRRGKVKKWDRRDYVSYDGIVSGHKYLWATSDNGVVRLTPPTGQRRLFTYPQALAAGRPTIGPDRAIWFTASNYGAAGALPASIVRMTPGGRFTTYTLPTHGDHALGDVTAGPDDTLWFLDLGYPPTDTGTRAVWRATTYGQLNEFDLPLGTYPVAIASGGGSVWVAEWQGKHSYVLRLSNTGVPIHRYRVGTTDPFLGGIAHIVPGRDRAMWFSDEDNGVLGRIDFKGKVSKFEIDSTAAISPGDLAIAPNRRIWYSDREYDGIGYFKQRP